MGVLEKNDYPYCDVSDYEVWEGNWELIEGIPYAMSPAPTMKHQSISQKIAAQLFNTLKDCKKCQAMLPINWKMADDTVVKPDNLVICSEASGLYLTQTPGIVFEILSPSTAKKDEGIKFELYQKEGVKYYIIVNPETSVAKVFKLTDDGRLIKKKDAKNDVVSLSIEDCKISFDFSKIW